MSERWRALGVGPQRKVNVTEIAAMASPSGAACFGELFRTCDTRDAAVGASSGAGGHPRRREGRQSDHHPQSPARDLRAGRDTFGVRSAGRRPRSRRTHARSAGRHRTNLCARAPQPASSRRVRRLRDDALSVVRAVTADDVEVGGAVGQTPCSERPRQCLWFRSGPAEALFHADCGGRTSRPTMCGAAAWDDRTSSPVDDDGPAESPTPRGDTKPTMRDGRSA